MIASSMMIILTIKLGLSLWGYQWKKQHSFASPLIFVDMFFVRGTSRSILLGLMGGDMILSVRCT
jgi:hypothetical protein